MKILHIELSKLIKEASKDIIEDMDHDYYSADSVAVAIDILNNHAIDLIITGLELADDDGEMIIKHLSEASSEDIPIVVLTSTDSLEMRKKLFELGVVDYQIKKNFTGKRLKTYIETIELSDDLIDKLRLFKIAVVDDSIFTLNVIKNIFTLNGVEDVDYYSDAKTLLDSGIDYDLYIIDLVMPDTTGEELIYRIKEIDEDNIIILISSTSNYKTISHILNTGANDFIVKPFDANTFIIRIKSHIRTYLLLKELEEKNKALNELAITDGLTKVYNHRHIVQLLKEEVSRAERHGHDLSIILIDLDDFKNVNDVYGHQVGDLVLRAVSDTIKKNIREEDSIGRYGGEEFLVVLPYTNVGLAKQVGEKLRKEVEELRIEIESLKITISGGIASYEGFDYSAMIKIADVNLYKAKSEGKNKLL
jgi:two-component system cell cycle response regulator